MSEEIPTSRPAQITLNVRRAGTGDSYVTEPGGGTEEPSYMESSKILGEKWWSTEHRHSIMWGRAAKEHCKKRRNMAFDILIQVWLKYRAPNAWVWQARANNSNENQWVTRKNTQWGGRNAGKKGFRRNGERTREYRRGKDWHTSETVTLSDSKHKHWKQTSRIP